MCDNSYIEENDELAKILATKEAVKNRISNKNRTCIEKTADSEAPPIHIHKKAEETNSSFFQWSTPDDIDHFVTGKTLKELVPGFYEPRYGNGRFYLSKLDYCVEGLIKFPDTNFEKILNEIQNFWDKEEVYHNYKLHYKRGMIFWGPPGSGKSSIIKLIIKDLIERKGVAIKFNAPDLFVENVRALRRIQPTTPILALLEDMDSIIERYDETSVLNILDGVEKLEKIVYIATTNYPEKLGERIINRPSRFDRRYKIPFPSKQSRKIYLEYLMNHQKEGEKFDFDINSWVADTAGMSISHIKELFIAVCILGDPYDEVLATLRSMNEEKVSSSEDGNKNIGFVSFKSED